ncbi:MAG: glycosyltransferase family 2 protein [Terrimicrobiaceae bacterium]
MKTTLLLATLNEIDGMKAIMPRIQRDWYDQLIVVDGGSTDGTLEYCKENGYFVMVQKGKGIRTALDQGFRLVEGDIVVTFTPDGNSIPELIPAVIAKMREGYDMVIVSRYLEGARSQDDSFLSGMGNWAFTFLINLIFRANYTDSLIAFRAFKTESIKLIGLANGPTNAFEEMFYQHTSWDFLSSVRCAKCKMRVADIPGDEPARIGGVEKVSKIKVGLVLLIQLILERFIDLQVDKVQRPT